MREEKQKIEEIKNLTQINFSIPKEEIFEKTNFEIKDYVQIKDSGTTSEIVEIDFEKRIITLDTGKLRIKVKSKNLIHTKKNKETNAELFNNFAQNSIESSRLDIRGRKPEEVEFEIIKFIDNAFLSNLKNVEIIHGKGTGVLRETVHHILKNHEMVKSFELANADFGGAGATFVKLK